jgi:hypothetical protein
MKLSNTRAVWAALYLFTLAAPAFAEKTAPAPAGLVRLKRPLKLAGKVGLDQLDRKLPLEPQFRAAWNKKYGSALDSKFKLAVSNGGAVTVLKSPQEVRAWMDRTKAAGTSFNAFKVAGSPEVKLVMLREFGALALRDLDEQVDFNLARYKETMTPVNAENARVVDYEVLLRNDLLVKMDQIMGQIDAMIDQMFSAATDQFGGLELAGLVVLGALTLGVVYLASSGSSGSPSSERCCCPPCYESMTGHQARLHAAHSVPAQPEPDGQMRYCPLCQSGIVTQGNPPALKLAEAFNAYHAEMTQTVDAQFKNLTVR